MKRIENQLVSLTLGMLVAYGSGCGRQPPPEPAAVDSIYEAVEKGDVAAVERHLQAGAAVDAMTKHGSTPLLYATAMDKPDVVRLLLDQGADVNAASASGSTPLIEAVGKGQGNLVRLLLEKGADVNVVDSAGYTPLLYAAANGDLDVVRLLVEKGANINQRGRHGLTPLESAAQFDHEGVVSYLRQLDGTKEGQPGK